MIKSEVTDTGMQKIRDSVEIGVRLAFVQAAQNVFERINNSDYRFGDYSLGLKNSMGVGIFKDGVLTDWVHNPAYEGDVSLSVELFGADMLSRAVEGRRALDMALQSEAFGGNDWSFIFIAAAPYAEIVDEGFYTRTGINPGQGWWTDDFRDWVIKDVVSQLKIVFSNA